MKPLADREERRVIQEDLDRNVVVEAAAGTGKTTELVNRIIATLADGRASVRSLVAVTFTEKAAGELKLRLRAGLEEARHKAPAPGATRGHLENALARLEEARVNTIHGFCADLLRERPVEARVDPQFRVLTEAEAERLYTEAFDRWLQERLEDPPEGLRRSLRRKTAAADDGPAQRLRQAGWTLAAWRDFPAPWRRAPFGREARVDDLVRQVHDFADLTGNCGKPEKDGLYKDTAAVRRLSEDISRTEAVNERDYDGLEAALIGLGQDRDFRRPRSGYGEFYAREIRRDAVRAAHTELGASLQDFTRAADADLAPLLQGELRQVTDGYELIKQRLGILDFVDLLVRARDLVCRNDVVRRDFQAGISHMFVDEFQDTDPLQAEILLLLAADNPSVTDWRRVRPVPGKLFIVGDPKQSIYRFRRADVGTYVEVKEQLLRHGACLVYLNTSFRSVPSIQRAVNTAFAPLMTSDAATLQAAYVPLSAFREETADQPTVVALPVPRPYGVTRVTRTAIEKSLPDAVGAFVHWLLRESGWTVTERERPGDRVPVSPRHVCLLFRRFDSYYAGDVTRAYVQALEARQVPHVLVGGKSFHGREEVETMRTVLTAIEWPDDELAVFASLHGSLFAVGDEELLEYRHRYGALHPFHLPAETVRKEFEPVVEALAMLACLHRERNERSIAETINLVLETTRAHAGFVLRPSGEQVLANVLHVGELARAYEGSGGLSFRGFVERLLEEADGGRAAEAPILEEGSEGVRIMTTHRAKGLEFPVVILADPTARPTGAANRYIDARRGLCALRIAGWAAAELHEHEEEERARDEAEALRVIYVAATRARDLLVVPAVGDEPFEGGWISSFNGALYPSLGADADPQPAPRCPSFGNESVCRPRPERFADARSVRPGLHHFADAEYDVVWWDPQALALGAQPLFGIRQKRLIGKDTERALVEADLEAHERWRAARQNAVDHGARPSLRVISATQHAIEMPEGGGEVEILDTLPVGERPGGPRFGALVHAALATVPLDAGAERAADVVGLQGRILGANEEEIAAAARAVHRTLRHPLLQRAQRALVRGECRRETPVTLCDDDGLVIDGIVDLAFREQQKWTVVDFKTDRDWEKHLDVYRRQVALYARAIARATQTGTSAVLMRV
jgi:ATP-dependent exoDNAse (exonuclease V) beta subunit